MNWISKLQNPDAMEQVIYIILAASAALFIIYVIARLARRRTDDADDEAYLMDIEKISGRDRYPLKKGKLFRIGRVAPKTGKGNALVIAQTTVGRRHAVITRENDTYWVTDLDSLNGTFVNGHPVSGKSRLESGDIILFHQYKFRFMLPSASSSDEDATQLADHDDMEAMTQLADGIPAPSPLEPQPQAGMPDNPMPVENMKKTQTDDAADGNDKEDITLDNFIDDKTISSEKS